jgi:hypothetical protein
MAVSAPARRAAPATAPPPSRTTAPKRKASAGAAAPARTPQRKAPARKPAQRKPRANAGTVTVPAPARRKPLRRTPGRRAPATPAPRRAKPGSRVAAGGQLIPIAAARTFVAARNLPDSGLVVRMTRGRAWIAVLGVLLVGIVTLNVVTLSFAASSGKINEQITALEEENSSLAGRASEVFSTDRVRHEASEAGLYMPNTEEPLVIDAGKGDIAKAAQRLAQLGPG